MKLFKVILIICVIISINNYSYGILANNIPNEIINAFKNGNSKELSKYFNITIEMTILDNEGIYSKIQAEQIIADFFLKNPPINFQVIHQGGKEGSRYAICEFNSSEKKFRVTIYLKEIENNSFIHQLRIQYDNN
ncbi:MAG: DUF4783 domain-containing protein [Bacteroidales bacterium]|nr:DUF4783 domain-containing protein [Bacteroidales bacterium]